MLETIEKDVIDFKIITSKTRHKYNKCKCKKCNKVINAEIPKNQQQGMYMEYMTLVVEHGNM